MTDTLIHANMMLGAALEEAGVDPETICIRVPEPSYTRLLMAIQHKAIEPLPSAGFRYAGIWFEKEDSGSALSSIAAHIRRAHEEIETVKRRAAFRNPRQ